MRRKLQKSGRFGVLKIKSRERNIVKDLNHKVAKKIVEIAKEANAGIKLERPDGIRNNKKQKANRLAELLVCCLCWDL